MKLLIPEDFYRNRVERLLEEAALRPDFGEIKQRVDYYMKLDEPFHVPDEDRILRDDSWILYTGRICDYTRGLFHSAYFFDQHDVTRYFPSRYRWNYCPGDVYFTPDVPSVVKSRLLAGTNHNSVLLKLDKLRHFTFLSDKKPFREKKDMAVFRGKLRHSRLRSVFLEKYFGNPLCNCGVVGSEESFPEKWLVPKMSIREHLDYKYIMAIEGNDVATNLKWVMSSNSIAVMPRPTCETWFMEGTLIPGYHYIEVKDDFSDLPEKLRYYSEHPEEAEAIIAHAHEHVERFLDSKREKLISLLVMEKYFRLSGQLHG